MNRKRVISLQLLLAGVLAAGASMPGLVSAQEAEGQISEITVFTELERQKSTWLLAPGSFSVKEGKELDLKQAQSLSDILRHEPGVKFTGGPRPGAEVPQIRGFDGSKVLILEDGARQNFQSGHSGRIFTDATFLETVEVVKGPWSSLYGSGALGGVIALRRPTAPSYLRRNGGRSGFEVTGESEGASSGHSGRVTGFAKAGFFEPLISVRQGRAGDIRLGGGQELGYSARDFLDGYASLGFELNPEHRSTLKLSHGEAKGIAPLNPNEEGTGAANDTADMSSKKTDFIFEHSWKSGPLVDFQAVAYFRRSDVGKRRLSDDRLDLQRLETTGGEIGNNFASKLSERWESVVSVGLEAFDDKQVGRQNGGALRNFPDARGSVVGMYLQPQLIFDGRTKIAPGLRYDKYRAVSNDVSADANEGDELSGKMAVVHEYVTNKSVFAAYSQGFNAPRLQDLYVSGLHFPGMPPNFFVPNPGLKPERTESFELGSKNRWEEGGDAIEVDFTLHRTLSWDLIERSVNVPGGTTQFVNRDKALLYGFEWKSGWTRGPWKTILSYDQTRGVDRETDEPLTDISAAQWSLGLERFLGINNEYLLGTEIEYVERQSAVPAAQSPIPSYVSQDVYFRYGNRRRPGPTFGLRANNVFDRKYRRAGSNINETGSDLRLQASWLF